MSYQVARYTQDSKKTIFDGLIVWRASKASFHNTCEFFSHTYTRAMVVSRNRLFSDAKSTTRSVTHPTARYEWCWSWTSHGTRRPKRQRKKTGRPTCQLPWRTTGCFELSTNRSLSSFRFHFAVTSWFVSRYDALCAQSDGWAFCCVHTVHFPVTE